MLSRDGGKMAAGGSLDDLLNAKVDETAFTALVGTLEDHLYSGQQLNTSGQSRAISSSNIGSNTTGHVRTNGPQLVKDENKIDLVSRTSNNMGVRSVSAYSQAGVIQTANFSTVSTGTSTVGASINANAGSVVKMVNNSVQQVSSVLPATVPTLSNGSALTANGKQSVGIGAKIMDSQVPVTQTVISVNRPPGLSSSGALSGVVPAGVVNSGVQIVNMNQLRTQSPTLINQKALAPRVVLSPQVLNRAAQPGQPVTLQTLQGLQGSTTGHLLFKTENGQLKLIQLPVQGATSAAAQPAVAVGQQGVSSAVSATAGTASFKFSSSGVYQQQQHPRAPIPDPQCSTSSVMSVASQRVPSSYYHPHYPAQSSTMYPARGPLPPASASTSAHSYRYRYSQPPHQPLQQYQHTSASYQSSPRYASTATHKGVAVSRTASVMPVACMAPTALVTGPSPSIVAGAVSQSSPASAATAGHTAAAAVQTASPAQQRGTPSQTAMTPDTAKIKCKNFLATLLRLAKEQPDQVARNVRELIQSLIDARLEPESFTTKLQEELNSSPQPCLVPFLKKSLPYLRQSLYNKDITIEGVRPPPYTALSSPLNTASVMQASRSTAVTIASTAVAAAAATPQHSPLTGVRVVSGGVTHTKNISTHPALMNVQTYQPGSVASPSSRVVRSVPAVYSSGVAASPTAASSHYTAVNRVGTIARQSVATAGSAYHQHQSHIQGGATPGVGVASAAVGGATNAVGGASASLGVTSYTFANRRDKTRPMFKFSYETGHEDDINDVAAMGGVNLHEESQHILGSTEYVGTQIRSVKDETLLSSSALQARLRQIMLRHGLDEPLSSSTTTSSSSVSDLTALVSHAVELRLRSLLQRLSVIAEHRADLIKTEQRHTVSRDVRGQLRFLEELDRLERRRHDELEREMLLRAAKSRSKTEDPEQAKLKAKAKEMQRVEMEEVRQREANITALQAIGPRKKPRLDLDGAASGSGVESSSGGPRQVTLRQRVRRVNIRDLLFLLEQERCSQRSNQLYKLMLR